MRIFIKTITGFNVAIESNIKGATFTLDVEPSDTVESVKQKMYDNGYPPESQRYICGGRCMSDGYMLSDFRITEDTTIHMVVRLRNNNTEVSG